MLVLLGCALARLTIAQQEQNRLCDTALTISNDFNGSQSEDGKGNGSIHNRSLSAWNWIGCILQRRQTIKTEVFTAQNTAGHL
ncbi:interleukin 17a/f2 isoform X3 [Danio rerio]|uniref:Interleukin 17a/f2 isoform X3 n=1 Tax=Danio rerio TaxID=7955 RepID=A0AC58HN57_DANRE